MRATVPVTNNQNRNAKETANLEKKLSREGKHTKQDQNQKTIVPARNKDSGSHAGSRAGQSGSRAAHSGSRAAQSGSERSAGVPSAAAPWSRVPHSDLLLARYKPETQRKYMRAFSHFRRWAKERHPSARPSTFDSLDRLLSNFINHLYKEGLSLGYATLAFCGVLMRWRGARGHLPNSAAMLSGWRLKKPAVQRPPITWPLTCAVAHQLASTGHFKAAVATLLAFDCLLRIGEVTSLRPSHVSDSADVDRSLSHHVSLYLPQTKTGMNQSVQIADRSVCALVMGLVSGARRARAASATATVTGAQPEPPLFGLTGATYRKLFKGACAQLGLSDKYVPHSLRHGGATYMYMMKKQVLDIKV